MTQPLPQKIPVSPATFHQVQNHDLDISSCFEASYQIDHQLQRFVEVVLLRSPTLGGEPMTAAAVNRTLLEVLEVIDQLLPSRNSMRINFRIFRDQADSDSQMTLRSATGSSLRPDLQLRAQDQLRLLFKGEEKGQGHNLPDALQVPPSCWTHAAATYS